MRKLTQHKGTFTSSTSKNCEDAITVGQFSQDGTHLALGDTFGRILLFSNDDESQLNYACEMKAYSEGHDWANKATDHPSVKSLEWMENHGARKGLVTAGGREIKLWKLIESQGGYINTSSGIIPKWEDTNTVKTRVTPLKCLPGLHTSPIKGLSLSSNEEYLVSFDSNRILRWNLQFSNQPHIVFSGSNSNNNFHMKPQALPVDSQTAMQVETTEEELTEFEQNEWADIDLLTAVKLQPGYDNSLAYGTKNGDINYIDMRATSTNFAHSDQTKPSIVMAAPTPDHFLKRYINAISDFCFIDQYTLVSRDYLCVKVWDLRNPLTPKSKCSIFPAVTSQLCQLYDNGRLTDKFSIAANTSGTKVVTPHYDFSFHEIDLTTVTFELIQNENIRYRVDSATSSSWKAVRGAFPAPQLDGNPRTESACYNPLTDDVCVTIQNDLFMFSTQQSPAD